MILSTLAYFYPVLLLILQALGRNWDDCPTPPPSAADDIGLRNTAMSLEDIAPQSSEGKGLSPFSSDSEDTISDREAVGVGTSSQKRGGSPIAADLHVPKKQRTKHSKMATQLPKDIQEEPAGNILLSNN